VIVAKFNSLISMPPASLQDNFLRFLDLETIAKGTFPDYPLDSALAVVRSMGRHSNASFTSKVTYEGWREVAVSWILCERDFIIPPDVQRGYIETIGRESGRDVDLHVLDTGHSPNTTAPEALAEVLVKIVAAEA
jgi:pimeloyl-ACP methyl ester carboxylesterase